MTSKRPHRAVTTAVRVVHGVGVRTGYGTGVGSTGGYLGGLYRGTTSPPSCPQGGAPYSEAGPGRPCRGLEWVVRGAGCVRAMSPPCGPGRSPCRCPPWDMPLLGQMAASGPIRRELRYISVKLVKTTECHRNMCKRPVIVPISKTGTKSHLLIF